MGNLKKMGEVFKILPKKMEADEAAPYASQLTYSLLLAIFPFIIFLFTVIGFLHLDTQTILTQMQRVMPSDTYTMFSGIIKDVMERQSGGLLSISILTAIWSSSSGFRAFIKAMNKVHGIKEDRSFIKLSIMSVINVIALVLGIVLSFFLLIYGQQIFDTIASYTGVNLDFLKSGITKIMPFIFIFVIFILFYMYVPARNVKVKYALPGAVFASVAFFIVSLGFKFYVDNYGNYSKFYGTMATVVVLMLWLLIMSNIMIIGGEINSILIELNHVYDPFQKKSAFSGSTLSRKAVSNIKKKKPDDIHGRI